MTNLRQTWEARRRPSRSEHPSACRRGSPRGSPSTVLVLVLSVLLGIAEPARTDDTGMTEITARMDRLWAERERAGAMQDLVTLGMLAQSLDPQSYEAQWRTARAAFWVARTQNNRIAKKAWAGQAKALAEHAVTLGPNRVEGHYFTAVALGEYAVTTGIVRAVTEGLVGRIESAALKAYELDRDFDGGAPMAMLGRFYFLLPWPKRDLPRSRHYLEELRERQPKALTGRYYLAETLHAIGDDNAARKELDYIIGNAQPVEGPEMPDVLANTALHEWFDE